MKFERPIATAYHHEHKKFLEKKYPDIMVRLRTQSEIPGSLNPFDVTGLLFFSLEYLDNTPGDILEIGTLFGKSLFILSLAAERYNCELYSVDPMLLKREYEPTGNKPVDFISRHITHPKLHLVHGNSPEAIAHINERKFKFIFVDDGHTYEDVKGDCSVVLRLLVSGGIAYFHDYTAVQFPGCVQAINEFIDEHNDEFKIVCITEQNIILQRV